MLIYFVPNDDWNFPNSSDSCHILVSINKLCPKPTAQDQIQGVWCCGGGSARRQGRGDP